MGFVAPCHPSVSPPRPRPCAHVVQPLMEDDVVIANRLQALQDVGAAKAGVPGVGGRGLSGAGPITGVPAPSWGSRSRHGGPGPVMGILVPAQS